MSDVPDAEDRPKTIVVGDRRDRSAVELFHDVHDAVLEALEKSDEGALEDLTLQLEACDRQTRRDAVFSVNEEVDDIQTQHLPLLLVDHYRARVHQLARGEGRLRHVLAAKALTAGFLDRLARYRLLDPRDAEALAARAEDEGGATAAAAGRPRLPPSQDREAKIRRFKRQREVKARLEGRRLRHPGRAHEDGAAGGAGDEEEERALALAMVECAALQSLDDLSALEQELGILRHMAKLREDAEREGGPGAGAGIGGGPGSRPGLSGPPPLDPNRPGLSVTHIGPDGTTRREQIKAQVFRPGHRLPTMSIEEFAEREVAEALEREQRQRDAPGPDLRSDQLAAKGEEDNEALADIAVRRDREWEDWRDDNPKGAGVTKRF